MKICISVVVLFVAGAHAFHDIHSEPEELLARNFNYRQGLSYPSLESTNPRLRVRSGIELNTELIKRGGCIGKGCFKTKNSGDQTHRPQQRQQDQPQRSQPQGQGQGQSLQRLQGQSHPEIQPLDTPSPSDRGRSPTRDSSRSNPGANVPGRTNSGSSDNSGYVPFSEIRLGALTRGSPSWRRDGPIRASSHATQQFVNSLRNPETGVPASESPNNSGGRIPAGPAPNSAISSGSSPPRSRPQESPYNSGAQSIGAVSLNDKPSEGSRT